MLTRLAEFVIRFRWWVIGGWVVVFLVSVPFAPRVTSQLKHGFGDLDTESRAALSLVGEELDFTESSITLVFSSETLDVDDLAYAEAGGTGCRSAEAAARSGARGHVLYRARRHVCGGRPPDYVRVRGAERVGR